MVEGNLIGTGKNARKPLPNDGDGVFITGSKGHLIGGTFSGQGNVIAFNGGSGIGAITVVLSGSSLVPSGDRFTNNSIFRNGGLGIDRGGDGLTPNDPVPDPDSGPNGLQNFPRIASAAQTATNTVVRGSLASKRSTSFEIQLFATPAGDAEGKTVLSTFTVASGNDGKVSFTRNLPSLPVGTLITATATDLGRLQTSELSPGRPVTP